MIRVCMQGCTVFCCCYDQATLADFVCFWLLTWRMRSWNRFYWRNPGSFFVNIFCKFCARYFLSSFSTSYVSPLLMPNIFLHFFPEIRASGQNGPRFGINMLDVFCKNHKLVCDFPKTKPGRQCWQFCERFGDPMEIEMLRYCHFLLDPGLATNIKFLSCFTKNENQMGKIG